MPPIGIPLPNYEQGTFRKVPAHMRRNPDRSFDLAERLGARVTRLIKDHYGDEGGDLGRIAHRIPMRVFERITPDELCKVRYSCPYMMDTSVEDAFKREPHLYLFHKIKNSMWRWGCGRGDWNEIVDAYEGIRGFDLGHRDFEITLDHTTGFNERGYSEHSRTYLDGVFGFLVHFKGEHVLTIGFSVAENRRLLLQQIQSKSRSGNRWRFKLPENLLEHVVDRLGDAFPRHRLFVADGRDLMSKNIRSYEGCLRSSVESEERARKSLARDPADEYAGRRLKEAVEEQAEFRKRIAHAKADRERIGEFYARVGRHALGKGLRMNEMKHYEVVRSAPAA